MNRDYRLLKSSWSFWWPWNLLGDISIVRRTLAKWIQSLFQILFNGKNRQFWPEVCGELRGHGTIKCATPEFPHIKLFFFFYIVTPLSPLAHISSEHSSSPKWFMFGFPFTEERKEGKQNKKTPLPPKSTHCSSLGGNSGAGGDRHSALSSTLLSCPPWEISQHP